MKVYIDGSYSKKTGRGGWAVYSKEKELKGETFQETTSNRMEMMAALEALKYLNEKGERSAIIYTDSIYIKKGVTEWLETWLKNKWKTYAGRKVLNRDLWEQINSENAKLQVKWKWVKGHSGIEGNERADRLAKGEI